jgi:hypothetical protein
MLLTSDRQRDAIPLGVCEFGKTRCEVSTAGLHRPLAARVALKLNMSWRNPDLYLFLSLLAGFATYWLSFTNTSKSGNRPGRRGPSPSCAIVRRYRP